MTSLYSNTGPSTCLDVITRIATNFQMNAVCLIE